MKDGKLEVGDRAVFGNRNYSVSHSNVDSYNNLRDSFRTNYGFHWRNDTYFKKLEDGSVRVRHCADWNYCPQVVDWIIPAAEWKSIVDSMETACQ